MKRTTAGTGRWVLYVLAGTETEAEDWATLNRMRRDRWQYVSSLASLEAMTGADMFMPVGTYQDRSDYLPLMSHLRINNLTLTAWTGQDAQLVGTPLPRTAP